MDIPETSDKYLIILYLRTKNDIAGGYESDIISKLTGINSEQANTVNQYLIEAGLIEKQQSNDDRKISLSSKGIDRILKLRENRIFKTIKFYRSQYVPPEENATYDFVYSYDLIDENGKAEKKTIKVSISDVLSMIWRFKEGDLEKVLLQFAKDKIIQKLKDESLNDYEELQILRKTHPDICPYNPENLIETKFAEYEVETGQKVSVEEIKESPITESIRDSHLVTN